MRSAIIGGFVRAIVPAVVGYFAGKGIDLSGFESPEATLAITTLVAVAWSALDKLKKPAANQ